MLLKSLKLKDFRQFIGEQSVSFSTDPEKNVTIIMGENGSGKTTFAQAFTWCLYGATDFDDKILLCKATRQKMMPGDEEKVRVEIELTHNGTDYTVVREQIYKIENSGSVTAKNAIFNIAYKNKDGQREFIDPLETELRMKEILPRELSKYFFFDGERIGNMSKEIKKGKSQDFAQAVRGLLGLNAFIVALRHLKSGRNSVIRSYNDNYDANADSRIAIYSKKIEEYEERLSKIEARLIEIEAEETAARDKCDELNEKIKENAESEQLAKERDKSKVKLRQLEEAKVSAIRRAVKVFNQKGASYFAKKMMKDALSELSNAEKLDTGIPDIHARTIEYLIKRGTCICGNHIEIGNDAYNELNKVLQYIPPRSIGTLIGQFARECDLKAKNGEGLFDDIAAQYSVIRDFEITYSEYVQRIKNIESKLIGMQNVSQLQQDLMKYERITRDRRRESSELNAQLGSLTTQKERQETERKTLTLKDESNRKIEIYKAYAEYMYNTLSDLYKKKETETREKLEQYVNEIFKSIYNGGLSLSIDDKYNIQINVSGFNGYNEDVETSTAQSISVIFAFIAGVIKMARENRESDNKMLDSEPYPLVMDAPLSAFDKTRIKTVCDALPKVAEQVIIFIKDTDGDIAEEHMGAKVGQRYSFDKINEFETHLV